MNDDHMVKFGEMMNAMKYLTEQVNDLRYKLLQYESGKKPVCEKPKKKRKSNS